ncbi:MAG: hypothetical protein HY703_04125 [Gemmatimonadetes bacterium]|nr:hypothetical protein [Gemmatimonadota bacterium]
MHFQQRAPVVLAVLAAAAVLLPACGDDDGTGPDGPRSASLSFTVPRPGGSAPPGFASLVPVTDAAGRVLNIDSVQVVLAEVELERADDPSDCDSSGRGNPCDEFEAGPVLVSLPVNGGVITAFQEEIPPGTYDELELEIEEPEENDAATQAFRTRHPSWPISASVHVKGTFDANDGKGPQPVNVFIQGEGEIERKLQPPFVVATGTTGTLNVTVAVDVASWFRNSDGSLIDPRALAADGNLRDRVEENIKRSFRAFKDADRDGDDKDEG